MRTIIIALKAFLFFTILTGIIYPLFITGISQILFPEKSNGSLIIKENSIIGSRLIGQQFDSKSYFASRPSAISYNTMPSGGSNLGLSNSKLLSIVRSLESQFLTLNQLDSASLIPSEMLFASASGLDPHISPEAARLQVKRICETREFTDDEEKSVIRLINELTESPQFLCLGQERINVLLLNIGLDRIDNNNADEISENKQKMSVTLHD